MSHKSPGGEPYISASTTLPEITLKALILSVLLAVVLGAANAYLGLKVGLTVSASIPAAVISMALLRAFKHSNILENNIVQTAASAGESVSAGVIFTLPALVILGTWTRFNYLETTMIACFGGILGVLFTIPLRRALIIESPLRFPEGVGDGGSSEGWGVWRNRHRTHCSGGCDRSGVQTGRNRSSTLDRRCRTGNVRRRNDSLHRQQSLSSLDRRRIHRRHQHRSSGLNWGAHSTGSSRYRFLQRSRAFLPINLPWTQRASSGPPKHVTSGWAQ